MRASLRVAGVEPPHDFQRPGGVEEREVCLPRSVGGSNCSATRPDLFLVSAPQRGIARLGYAPDTTSHPGAWTLVALPLPGDVSRRIQLPATADGERPAPPTQCAAGTGATLPGLSPRLFLPVPPYAPDEAVARQWAGSRGYAMAPPVACPAEVLRNARGGAVTGLSGVQDGAFLLAGSYNIASPRAGETVSGQVPIVGTANFDRSNVQFYKLEIGAGSNPTQWTTLGQTHEAPVLDGVLEELHAYALAPGPYVIRLVLVRHDGNYPPPHAVPIYIAEE
jgi:hypothetical protein